MALCQFGFVPYAARFRRRHPITKPIKPRPAKVTRVEGLGTAP